MATRRKFAAPTPESWAPQDGLLVSGTEPRNLQKLGITAGLPETFGVDFAWMTPDTFNSWGIQRKEFSDYVSSLHDGRLAKESQQMLRLDQAILVLEGKPRWTVDGELVSTYGANYTRDQHHGTLLSLQLQGWWVVTTVNLAETMELVVGIKSWTEKSRHDSLLRRQKITTPFGSATSRDFSLWVLQSWPGIGPAVAGAIVDHFGRLPLRWDITYEQLSKVAGVGPALCDRLFYTFEEAEKPKPRRRKKMV